ncbi:MAG TPA: radical SAM protein [Blastocatellia bacterium]|nr:radical SAM protein [Blastocatellia bacterium]
MAELGVLYSTGAIIRNSVLIEDDQFRVDLVSGAAEKLFRKHVELVEFETTSYCNRTCSFCPNSFIDRLTEKLTMPEPTWQAILDGLKQVDYSGTIVWSRYSEPLSERRILDRIREVRKAAPRSRICINSNGDFLDAEYLRELEDAGVDRLWVDIYFPDEEVYDLEAAKSYHAKFLKRIERTCEQIEVSPELAHRIGSKRTEIVTHVRNVAAMKALDLSDRGGLIQIARETSRDAPCFAPYKHLVIDWDGSVVICCQLRSDSPSHKKAVVGRIGADGIGLVDAYVRLAEWRYSLRGYGPKTGPCATCNVSEYASTPLTRTLSRVLTDSDSRTRAIAKMTLGPVLRRRPRF